MIYALLFAFLAIVLMIAGYATKRMILAYAACGFWLLAGLQARTVSTISATGVWDIYYGLFFLCIGFIIISALEGMSLRTKVEVKAEEEIDEDEAEQNEQIKQLKSDMDRVNRPVNSMRRAIRGKRRVRRKTSIMGLRRG